MAISTELTKLVAGLLPTKSITRIRGGRQELPVQTQFIDVDELHSILRTAEAGDLSRLFALYRDIISGHTHIQGEFAKRKLAVLKEDMALIPADPKDEAQAKHVAEVQSSIESLDSWFEVLTHWLDSTLYPVALTERTYRASSRDGWRYDIANIKVIPHNFLAWPQGEFSIRQTDDDGNFTTNEPVDPTRYIAHRGHLLTSVPDWWGGPMRAILFWWLFSVHGREWWARFMDRFGAPFIEGKYDSSDDRSRSELESAFSTAQRLFGIVVSREAEIKLHQVNTQGAGDAFASFHNVANEEISKLIVGQTMSSTGKNVGLGGGQAALQGEVRDDIRQFDVKRLAHTIRTRILAPLWQLNAWTSPIPKVTFGGIEIEEAEVNGAVIASLAQAGIEPTTEGLEVLANRLGFGLQRVSQPSQGLTLTALSATDNYDTAPYTAPAARRLGRKQQARKACEEVIAAASPQLARQLRGNIAALTAAIEDSTSPEDAIQRIAILTADFDPTDAAEIIQSTLSACASNAIAALDV